MARFGGPVLALLVACGGAEDRAEAILALSGDPATGELVYAANCETCHGPSGLGVKEPGGGYPANDLTAAAGEPERDADLVRTVLEGSGSMTAFADLLDDQEIADVLAYLHDGLIR